jgi:hypothetical protein
VQFGYLKQRNQQSVHNGSGGWSLASHRRGPGSIPGQPVWDLWWPKWHWDTFSSRTSVFQCSILIFIYMKLLPGQTGEAWEPSKKQCYFRNRGTLDRTVLSQSAHNKERSLHQGPNTSSLHAPLQGLKNPYNLSWYVTSTYNKYEGVF